jgi:hypothetical protein
MPSRKEFSLIVSLAGLCSIGGSPAFVTACGYADDLRGLRHASRDPPLTAETAPNIDNPLWSVPLSALSATRERPIFSRSRRQPAAVIAVPSNPPPPAPVRPQDPAPPQLMLVGTVMGESKQIGVFLDQTTKIVVHLEAGENHEGWVLTRVSNIDVQLENGRHAATFPLRSSALQGAPSTGMRSSLAQTMPVARHRKR